MPAKKAAKVPSRWVPQSLEEVDEAVAKIGNLQRRKIVEQTKLDNKVQAAKNTAAKHIAPLDEKIDELVEGIAAYSGANRSKLTDDGKHKTVKLRSGELRWRTTPPAVNLRGVESVIRAIKKKGWDHFLRIKSEVDKEALKREPALANTIPGVSITQREEFVVVPSETQAELVKPDKPTKVV